MREEEARLEEVYNRWKERKKLKSKIWKNMKQKTFVLKLCCCCRLEEEAERADRVAAIAEEEARRFFFTLNFLFDISDSELFLLIWTILDMKLFIFRLEQELVQKEAADAAMAREKEVLKII